MRILSPEVFPRSHHTTEVGEGEAVEEWDDQFVHELFQSRPAVGQQLKAQAASSVRVEMQIDGLDCRVSAQLDTIEA